jgi:hypothetical protein
MPLPLPVPLLASSTFPTHPNGSQVPSTPLYQPIEGGACLSTGGKKGSTPKKNHRPTTPRVNCCSKRCQLKPSRHGVIKFCRHPRGLMQWLYLRHCFLCRYFALHKLPSETTIAPPPTAPAVDSVLVQIDKILKVLDNELLALQVVDSHLDEAIAAFDSNSVSCDCSQIPMTTCNWLEISTSKSGPSAQPVPDIINVYTPLLSMSLHLRGGEDTSTPSECPPDFSFALHESNTPEQQYGVDRSFTTPSLSSSLSTNGSHGCNISPFHNNEPRKILQPHDPMSNNNEKKKNKENGLTTVYTQNAQGLWHHPRDPEGNILVDRPPDLSKLEYLIDFMRQNDVGAWLIQETWEEGGEFDVEVGGYHIFDTT